MIFSYSVENYLGVCILCISYSIYIYFFFKFSFYDNVFYKFKICKLVIKIYLPHRLVASSTT
jgi:hypothetical protein